MGIRSMLVCGAGLLFIGAVALASSEFGGGTFWQHDPATTGDWFETANWSAGLPAGNTDPIIENGGTAHVGAGAAAGRNVFIGFNDSGTLVHDGGTFTAGNGITLGQFVNFVGQYDISGTAVVNAPGMVIGEFGEGEVNMSGGTLDLTLNLGVGHSNIGRFFQTGGDVTVLSGCCNGDIDVGWGVASFGRYELSGTATLTSHMLRVGPSGIGEFFQDGGGVDVVNFLTVGGGAGSDGTYTLTGGGQIQCNRLDIGTGGNGGAGLFIHENGDVVIDNAILMSEDESTSTYLMQSGTLASPELALGSRGIARFEQTGGAVTFSGRVNALTEPTGDATLLISGGTFVTTSVDIGNQGNSTFRQTGGEVTMKGVSTFNNGGTLAFEMLGGVLHLGSFSDNLVNTAGTLAPGDPFGRTTITGNYTQLVGATSQTQLGGTLGGTSFDQVIVTGLVSLSGNLDVQLLNGFRPQQSDQFIILTAANISGVFNNAVTKLAVGDGVFDVLYTNLSVRLWNFTITCPSDGDGDGTVGIDDFLAVLSQWGPCVPTCTADVDDDGFVGILDFLAVLADWGPCP